ncbi:MAG: hypothetical protein AAF998_28165 [Bacteroidota bacterium]
MKRSLLMIFVSILVLLVLFLGMVQKAYTQTGGHFPVEFETVVRDCRGRMVRNEPAYIRFTIRSFRVPVYQEEQKVIPDREGRCRTLIGQIYPRKYRALNWSRGDYSLLAEYIDARGSCLIAEIGIPEPPRPPSAEAPLPPPISDTQKSPAAGAEASICNNLTAQRPPGSEITFSTGDRSLAFGLNSEASGDLSVAGGFNSRAEGFSGAAIGFRARSSTPYALAMGDSTEARGFAATALGYRTLASAPGAFAQGAKSVAEGAYSTAIGEGVVATAKSEVVFGRFNAIRDTAHPYAHYPADRIFSIGNGASDRERRDAFVVLKNGTVGIGTPLPTAQFQVGQAYDGTWINANAFAAPGTPNDQSFLRPVQTPLAAIAQMSGYYYRDNNATWRLGLAPGEVRQAAPELLYGSRTDPQIDYGRLTVLLLEAVQAQQIQIEALQAQLRRPAEAEGQHRASIKKHSDTDD